MIENEIKTLIEKAKACNLPKVTLNYDFLTKEGPLPTVNEIYENMPEDLKGNRTANEICVINLACCLKGAKLIAQEIKELEDINENKDKILRDMKGMLATILAAVVTAHALHVSIDNLRGAVEFGEQLIKKIEEAKKPSLEFFTI